MSFAKHKKELYLASLVAAFIFVLHGLSTVSLLPFSSKLTLDHPAAYGYDKNSMVIVDKQSRRLIRLDGENRVVSVSSVSSLPHVPKVIRDIYVYIDEMYIMGCDMHNDGSHIANERIEHYTLDGKYLGNVYSEYLPESSFRNRQSLYSMTVSGGEFFVVRAHNGACGLDVYNFSDMENVSVTSITNDVPIMAAYYDADGKRLAFADIYNNVYVKEKGSTAFLAYEQEFFQGRAEHNAVALREFKKAIKLSGEMPLTDAIYKIHYDDGCGLPIRAHFLRQHTDMYDMDFIDGSVRELKSFPLSQALLLYQMLYLAALIWLIAALGRMVFRIVKNGFYEGLGYCVAVLFVCAAVIGMNSYNSYQTLEKECLEKLEAMNNILKYDIAETHSDMFKKFGEQGIETYCKSPENMATLKAIAFKADSLINAFGHKNGFYGFIMAYDSNGVLYTLTDSQDEYPTGFHFGTKTSGNYRKLLKDGISRDKDYRGKYLCYRSEILSPYNATSVVVEIGCYTSALLKKSVIISARNFFDKYSIFIILCMFGLIISFLRKDIALHIKLKKSADRAFANIPFARINTILVGFLLGLDEIMFLVAVCWMYSYEPVTSLAVLAATPLLLHNVAAIVSNNVAPFVRTYISDKNIGCFSALFSACGYMLLAAAVTTKSYLCLCVGKTMLGFFLAGALSFMLHAVLSGDGAESVRKMYLDGYYKSKSAGSLLGIMASGYFATLWSFKGLYIFAAAASLLLLIAAGMLFREQCSDTVHLDSAKMRIALTALKSRDVLLYISCILFPAFAAMGFKEYLFPFYAKIQDYSPLLITNIVAFITGLDYLSSKAVGEVASRYEDRTAIFYAMLLLGISAVCMVLHAGIVFVALLMLMVTVVMSLVAIVGARYFRGIMQKRNVPGEIGEQLYAQLRSFSHLAAIIPLYAVNLSGRYTAVATGAVIVVTSLLFIKKSGQSDEINAEE